MAKWGGDPQKAVLLIYITKQLEHLQHTIIVVYYTRPICVAIVGNIFQTRLSRFNPRSWSSTVARKLYPDHWSWQEENKRHHSTHAQFQLA